MEKPDLPGLYKEDQIIFNSPRILLNAKEDFILASSKKGYNFSTEGGFHINGGDNTETSITVINTKEINLGLKAKDNGQPVTMANDTEVILGEIIDSITLLMNLYKGLIAPLAFVPLGAVGASAAAFPLVETKLKGIKTKLEAGAIRSNMAYVLKDS